MPRRAKRASRSSQPYCLLLCFASTIDRAGRRHDRMRRTLFRDIRIVEGQPPGQDKTPHRSIAIANLAIACLRYCSKVLKELPGFKIFARQTILYVKKCANRTFARRKGDISRPMIPASCCLRQLHQVVAPTISNRMRKCRNGIGSLVTASRYDGRTINRISIHSSPSGLSTV
jgi:hypothetical protein